MNHITKHLVIHGRVQGVGYRAWAAHTAEQMNLVGWARNRKNGTVEAVITGPEEDIQHFVSACYNGPSAANVEVVQVADGFDEELEEFEIRDTV